MGTTSCGECEDITICRDTLSKVRTPKQGHHSAEQEEDILYDFERSRKAISRWKAHIERTKNQERAKQEILENLIVMDWAMKFLQIRFRAKQSD